MTVGLWTATNHNGPKEDIVMEEIPMVDLDTVMVADESLDHTSGGVGKAKGSTARALRRNVMEKPYTGNFACPIEGCKRHLLRGGVIGHL